MPERDRVARFERLHGAIYPTLVACAVRRCADRTHAADAVAETYLVLWRRLDEAPDQVLPWLYGERKGWPVAQTFIDNDVSTTSGKPRRQYLAMMTVCLTVASMRWCAGTWTG